MPGRLLLWLLLCAGCVEGATPARDASDRHDGSTVAEGDADRQLWEDAGVDASRAADAGVDASRAADAEVDGSRDLGPACVPSCPDLVCGGADNCGGICGPDQGCRYFFFFGNNHAHSTLSDGRPDVEGGPQPTPAALYAEAGAQGHDFFVITDHVPALTQPRLDSLQQSADAATTATFVGMAGYEVDTAEGHINVFDPELVPEMTRTATQALRVGLYNWIRTQGYLGCFNHPNIEPGWDFHDYSAMTPARRDVMTTMEIFKLVDQEWDGELLRAVKSYNSGGSRS